MPLTILFVDNYDFFTDNLVEYVSQLPVTEVLGEEYDMIADEAPLEVQHLRRRH